MESVTFTPPIVVQHSTPVVSDVDLIYTSCPKGYRDDIGAEGDPRYKKCVKYYKRDADVNEVETAASFVTDTETSQWKNIVGGISIGCGSLIALGDLYWAGFSDDKYINVDFNLLIGIFVIVLLIAIAAIVGGAYLVSTAKPTKDIIYEIGPPLKSV